MLDEKAIVMQQCILVLKQRNIKMIEVEAVKYEGWLMSLWPTTEGDDLHISAAQLFRVIMQNIGC